MRTPQQMVVKNCVQQYKLTSSWSQMRQRRRPLSCYHSVTIIIIMNKKIHISSLDNRRKNFCWSLMLCVNFISAFSNRVDPGMPTQWFARIERRPFPRCNLSSYLFSSTPPMKTYAHYMFEWRILEPVKIW